jgi:hypothetical protein
MGEIDEPQTDTMEVETVGEDANVQLRNTKRTSAAESASLLLGVQTSLVVQLKRIADALEDRNNMKRSKERDDVAQE